MRRAAAIPSAISTCRNCWRTGIDVYTTLNIQHVESLNDVVAQITRIRVRETVPDSIIDRADDVEIIDLTPDDLIKRLHEGKVYMPKTAQRALENYFSPGNLTALRELALRRTAQRVDEQLLTHMQAHAIPGPWAAGDRVLVCVDEHPRGASLVRYARRQADRLRAPWAALHVETPRSAGMSEADKDRLAATLRLAEQLGGEAIDPARPERRRRRSFATRPPTTSPISSIGKPTQAALAGIVRGLGHPRSDPPCRRHQRPCHFRQRTGRRSDVAGVKTAAAAAAVRDLALSAGARPMSPARSPSASLLDQVLDVRNLALVFLMAVLTSAVTGGLWPALYACRRQRARLQFLLSAAALHADDPAIRRAWSRSASSSSSRSSPAT